jgi:hypothetical protein
MFSNVDSCSHINLQQLTKNNVLLRFKKKQETTAHKKLQETTIIFLKKTPRISPQQPKKVTYFSDLKEKNTNNPQ